MAEAVTTLERAVDVMNQYGCMGCHWRAGYRPDGTGGVNGIGPGKYCSIDGIEAIAVADQLLRDAEAKAEPKQVDDVDSPRVAADLINAVVAGLPDDAKIHVKGDAEYPATVVRADAVRAILSRSARPAIGLATRRILDMLAGDADEFIMGMWLDESNDELGIDDETRNLISAARRECGMEGKS